jgi:hypothetical protein
MSLIGAPLELEELALALDELALALEPEELELLLPQAATTSAVTIATAITPRR